MITDSPPLAMALQTPLIRVPGDDNETIMAKLRARIMVLELELDDAQFKIKEAVSKPLNLGYGWLLPPEWCLTGSEYNILKMLLARGNLTREIIFDNLYGNRVDQPDPKIVDVFICKLRKKYPGKIHTVWGQGYMIKIEERREMKTKYYTEDQQI